jgi:hypothetical protein
MRSRKIRRPHHPLRRAPFRRKKFRTSTRCIRLISSRRVFTQTSFSSSRSMPKVTSATSRFANPAAQSSTPQPAMRCENGYFLRPSVMASRSRVAFVFHSTSRRQVLQRLPKMRTRRSSKVTRHRKREAVRQTSLRRKAAFNKLRRGVLHNQSRRPLPKMTTSTR